MFDILTYIKGSAVLRMLEQYLGAETFRDGIRGYLVKHSYANAVTADLWAALETSSGQPVGEIMNSWILQGGFPLVTYENGEISQTPFSYTDRPATSNIGQDWKVPVLSRTIGTTDINKQLLSSTPTALATAGVAVVNAGGSGFFRTAYGSNELAALSSRLGDLDEIERSQLFADTWAAIMIGRSSVANLFTLAEGLGDLNEPSAWSVVIQAVNTINRIVDDEGRSVLADAVRQILAPQFTRLTWNATDGESEQAAQLRSQVIETLGIVGEDPAIIAEALRRFDANDVVGDLAQSIVRITARQNRPGDVAVFEERRQKAPTPQDEQLYLFAPAMVPDLAVGTDLFNRCFTDIRNQDAPYVVLTLITNRIIGAQIWKMFAARLDEAIAKFPSGSTAATSSAVASLIADPALADEIRAFYTANPLPVGQRQVEQALERMDIGVAFGQRVRDTITDQLRSVIR